MKCEEIEKLLPSFVEGQITEEEKMAVEFHLSECPLCRESYKRYILLEELLPALKENLPPSQIIADSVIERLNLKRRRSHITRLLNVPAAASFFMIILSLFTLIYHNLIFKVTISFGEKITSLFTYYSDNFSIWITEIYAGYFWPAFILFALLNLLIILSGGMIALRYIRE
jgi:predicted anti-sigma-YlaC factor YlaD